MSARLLMLAKFLLLLAGSDFRTEKPCGTRYECFWKHISHARFADVLLKLVQLTILLERYPHLQK